jgi:hypothetical protein
VNGLCIADARKDKLKRKLKKQVESVVQAKVDRSKRDGTYKSGQNMQGEEEQPTRAPKKSQKDLQCEFCGLKGHSTKRSKACLHYTGKNMAAPVSVTPPAANAALDPAEDTALYDTLPLVAGEQEPPDNSDVEDVTLANILNADPARWRGSIHWC